MTNRQSRRRFLTAASTAAALGGVAGGVFQARAPAAQGAESGAAGRRPKPTAKPAPFVLNYNKHDQQIWEEELEEFVPQRVFDTHCHLLNKAHLAPDDLTAHRRSEVDLATLQKYAQSIYHGRRCHFLILGKPAPGIDVRAHVRWVAKEAAGDPHSRSMRLTTPACKLEHIEQDVKTLGFVGLKVYRTFSVTGDIDQCRIHEFLTHPQMELANDLGLWVTMHLARSDGGGDKQNLDDLEEYTTRRYPNIKWILAHCARCFTYYQIREGIARLSAMPNIWYDLSAVCDPIVFVTLFQNEDTKRLFHGSDSIDATHFRGRYAVFGRAWQFIKTDKLNLDFKHCYGRPILAVYEQFLAMKQAAEIVGFSKDDIENIFWRNAIRALGIEKA